MPIRTVTTAAVFACLLLAAPAAHASDPTGRLLAVLDTPAPLAGHSARDATLRADRRERAADLIADLGRTFDVTQPIPLAGIAAVSPEPGQSLAALRSELLADPAVKRVDTEYYRQLRGYIPDDPAYSLFDSLNAPFPPNGDRYQWNLRKANFESAWAISRGVGATVAIVDSGVSGTSPDLTQIAAAHDNDPLDLDAITHENTDQNGHGTHVAGLACGNSDNGYGIASAGFDCPLIIEKLAVSGNNLSEASIIAGIADATARGAKVINLSLGGCGPDPSLRNAIDQAWAMGSVLVGSASNPGEQCGGGAPQGYPAAYIQPTGTSPDINVGKGLVVTMAQYDGANANAGHGTGVSVASYGDSSALPFPAYGHPNGLPGIFSTWPETTTSREASCPTSCPRTSLNGDTRFGYLFGTSMAAPQVSGLVALIRSANPGMAPSQVVQTVKRTASYGGKWADSLGWGIIDAGRAVAFATGRDVLAPHSKITSPKRTRKRSFRLEISSSDADPLGGASSGVRDVSVFAAAARGGFKLVATTSRSSISFRGKRGVKYRFYSLAVDRAENREADRRTPDSTTLVQRRPRAKTQRRR